MASERVARILRAKSAFTAEQIAAMSDAEGWSWIYANKAPPKKKVTQVCFTGFSADERAELERLAQGASLKVVGSVTKDLDFLCVGENAGPAKLKRAHQQGTPLMTREQFMELAATGEIPELNG